MTRDSHSYRLLAFTPSSSGREEANIYYTALLLVMLNPEIPTLTFEDPIFSSENDPTPQSTSEYYEQTKSNLSLRGYLLVELDPKIIPCEG